MNISQRTFVCIEYELVELYGAIYDGKVEINRKEVAGDKFISFEEERFKLGS